MLQIVTAVDIFLPSASDPLASPPAQHRSLEVWANALKLLLPAFAALPRHLATPYASGHESPPSGVYNSRKAIAYGTATGREIALGCFGRSNTNGHFILSSVRPGAEACVVQMRAGHGGYRCSAGWR